MTLFRIENQKNLHFIRQFIKEDIEINIEKYKGLKLFHEFVSTVNDANLASIESLDSLNDSYLVPISIQKLLEGQDVQLISKGNDTIPLSVDDSFKALMLEVGRTEIEYEISETGRISFNKKAFADRVMDYYPLVVDRNDPDALLVYNNKKGFWEDATQPLYRLIIEIAHSAGGNVEDTWTSHLEGSIIDMLKRKEAFIESANFNKSHFPLGNYTIYSTTGDLVQHASDHLATLGSSVNYNSTTDCPVFKQFLTDLFEDDETSKFVQEWFGYTLSCSHKANAFLIGVGSGANGKSTLFDVLAQLVGIENVASAPLSNFNSEFGLEPLIGKKLNLATESDVDAFKTGKLKALTAGEDISINRKNKIEITTKLPTKLVFLMNELPLLNDDSFGFERRLLILPFDKTFKESEQDKDLPKKLSKELEGILTWSLEGLKRLIANHYTFTVSKSMQDAKNLYLGVGNPIEKFVGECVSAKPSNVMDAKDLINAYIEWMMRNEFPFKGTDSPQKFWKAFEEAMNLKLISFSRSKSNGRTVVRDITLQ